MKIWGSSYKYTESLKISIKSNISENMQHRCTIVIRMWRKNKTVIFTIETMNWSLMSEGIMKGLIRISYIQFTLII
jgi:hypothetical protein